MSPFSWHLRTSSRLVLASHCTCKRKSVCGCAGSPASLPPHTRRGVWYAEAGYANLSGILVAATTATAAARAPLSPPSRRGHASGREHRGYDGSYGVAALASYNGSERAGRVLAGIFVDASAAGWSPQHPSISPPPPVAITLTHVPPSLLDAHG
eukprot:COSAG05_NODE_957_length_6426_cov_16.557768_2_plen_154_part_00